MQIIYWDEQSLYMEHRFIKPTDNFVHSIAICRQRVIDCSVNELMSELANIPGGSTDVEQNSSSRTCLDEVENGHAQHFKQKPPIPPEIQKWIEYNDLSSKALRAG